MTISEQLQFSVLTAPVAAVDRRTLSQAWYSALYRDDKRAASANSTLAPAPQAGAQRVNGDAGVRTAPRESPRVPAALSGPLKQSVHPEAAPQDRRAPRSALARKIERTFLRPSAASQKASFTVDGDGGRVHVLLRSQGTQLKLIAICPPKGRAHVAAALAQARYALAMRGINMDADTRIEGVC